MWLRRLWRTRPATPEIDAELRDHLERLVDDLRAQGLSPDEAMRQATLTFGNTLEVRTRCREVRTRHLVDRVAQWAHDVIRATRRDPLVTGVCIVTLGLGIGATTAVATLVDALLLRPLPYANADRLVELWTGNLTDPTVRRPGLDPAVFPELRSALTTVASHLEGYQYGTATLTGGGDAMSVNAPRITPGLLGMLGVVPRLGRLLDQADVADGHRVVIAESLWVDRFGADPEVIGSIIQLDDQPHVIVGVMPRSLQFPWQPAALWRSLPAGARPDRTQVVALLRGDLTPTAADSRLAALSVGLRAQGLLAADQRLTTAAVVQRRLAAQHRRSLAVMLGAVGLVLLVACLNVSSLLLARASSRESELALRSALGARRWTLVSRALGEGVVLTVAGAGAGLLVARLLIDGLVARLPDDLRFINLQSTADATPLSWLLAATLLSIVGVGVLPALYTRRAPVSVLNGVAPATRAGHDNWWQSGLVVAQLAAVLVVLSAGGLLLRSFVALATVAPGYDASGLIVASLQLPRHRYQTGEANVAFAQQVLERLSRLPGVRSATYAEGAPPSGNSFHIDAELEIDGNVRGTAETLPTITVMPAYFATLGIPIVQGRTFVDDDPDHSVIVSETLARRYWGEHSPIGRQFRWTSDVARHTVVGVAADAKQGGLDDHLGNGLAMYLPYRRAEGWPYVSFLIRHDDSGPSATDVRAVVTAVDPDLPLTVETMEERMAGSIARQRFFALLAAGFATIGVALAAVGIFGNAAYWVARRQRELALRMAIGASPSSIRSFVLARCLRLAAAGTVLGIAGAAIVSRALRSVLFGIRPDDPWTFAAVVALLALTVVLSAYLPARRASRLDPWRILQA